MLTEKIAEVITNWCETAETMSMEKKATVQFGLELGLDAVLKTAGVLLVGVICGHIWEYALALTAFSGLRMWAGGRHCKTSLGCFGILVLTVSVSVWGAEMIYMNSKYMLGGMWLLLFCLTACYAPMNSSKNPIEDQEVLRRKKLTASCLVLIEGCVTFVFADMIWSWIILLVVSFEVLSFLPFAACKQNRKLFKERSERIETAQS